jgi:hypothetical protein
MRDMKKPPHKPGGPPYRLAYESAFKTDALGNWGSRIDWHA